MNIIIIYFIIQRSKLTPWASGIFEPKFNVQVDLLIYCFQLSEPDYLPPPVYFYPPNAPPIYAPEGPILTLTIPQSEPCGPTHLNALDMFWVNKLLLNPWGTLLLSSIAYSKLEYFWTKRIGQKYYYCKNGAFLGA